MCYNETVNILRTIVLYYGLLLVIYDLLQKYSILCDKGDVVWGDCVHFICDVLYLLIVPRYFGTFFEKDMGINGPLQKFAPKIKCRVTREIFQPEKSVVVLLVLVHTNRVHFVAILKHLIIFDLENLIHINSAPKNEKLILQRWFADLALH